PTHFEYRRSLSNLNRAGILKWRKNKEQKNTNTFSQIEKNVSPRDKNGSVTTSVQELPKGSDSAGKGSVGNQSKKLVSISDTPFKLQQLPKLKTADPPSAKNKHDIAKNNQPPPQPPPPAENHSKIKNYEDFSAAVLEAKITENYKEIRSFFEFIYGSFEELVKMFKVDDASHNQSYVDLDLEFLDYVDQSIKRMPKDMQKVVLRSIINSIMKDHKGIKKTADHLRGYLILLLNPLFSDTSTYVIFAHLLRQIASFQSSEHHYLLAWFRRLDIPIFERIVNKIKLFVGYVLFPTKNDVPDGDKSIWWIPSAVKVLALFNAANEQTNERRVPTSAFYIQAIELLELVTEYQTWQSGVQKFSFCQYPFLLSLRAKRFIMQKDSETKMLLEARQSLVNKVRQKQKPSMGMLFLNLDIRRNNLLEDSLKEISKKRADLKKKLRVIFKGEPGIDLGGVSKEWFFLLIQKFFKEDYGMFKYSEKRHNWWFTASSKDSFKEYNLCGVLLGLAIYNGINLDIRFPPIVYKKLLSPAIVPYNNPHAYVGVVPAGVDDLKQVYPEVAQGLRDLLEYDGDVEDDLCQTFMISFTENGQTMNRQLKANGDTIPVTNLNRQEYVNLYCDYLVNKCIYQQFYSFYHGFHSVCASNALLLLRPEEVETLVIGNPNFNIKDLEKITKYDGFKRTDATIRYFWETVHEFDQKLQRKLLFFSTGSDRIPVGGFKEMKFKITRIAGQNAVNMLPMAHTCFNQLCLPSYKSRKDIHEKLLIAISNAEGFGLE
uniref:HECT-type E3 ubiquitin transferase n=1 Tax=Clytia hemisphaerica TaxID=252671 RepID=A0A7M5WR61_9CNID